jgi:hypothetical protein
MLECHGNERLGEVVAHDGGIETRQSAAARMLRPVVTLGPPRYDKGERLVLES